LQDNGFKTSKNVENNIRVSFGNQGVKLTFFLHLNLKSKSMKIEGT
jgi:hypothetical protein